MPRLPITGWGQAVAAVVLSIAYTAQAVSIAHATGGAAVVTQLRAAVSPRSTYTDRWRLTINTLTAYGDHGRSDRALRHVVFGAN